MTHPFIWFCIRKVYHLQLCLIFKKYKLTKHSFVNWTASPEIFNDKLWLGDNEVNLRRYFAHTRDITLLILLPADHLFDYTDFESLNEDPDGGILRPLNARNFEWEIFLVSISFTLQIGQVNVTILICTPNKTLSRFRNIIWLKFFSLLWYNFRRTHLSTSLVIFHCHLCLNHL